jgi:uncharacterized metal-binding protein
VLILEPRNNGLFRQTTMQLHGRSLEELVDVLTIHYVDVLVCGGISSQHREFVTSRRLDIIDNVACTVAELLEALQRGALRPGFGLSFPSDPADAAAQQRLDPSIETNPTQLRGAVDCLSCTERVCLRGGPCPLTDMTEPRARADREELHMLEAALDIECESDRTLCRLSELIYFCLEMNYMRIGLAFCTDLQEPAEIVTRVLRRFFTVFPVSCKLVGRQAATADRVDVDIAGHPGPSKLSSCNPRAQAEVLNRLNTDLNVLVGICMGADCVLTRISHAPVTTLFVKDRSLVNNPIAAVYSDYYLNEVAFVSPGA